MTDSSSSSEGGDNAMDTYQDSSSSQTFEASSQSSEQGSPANCVFGIKLQMELSKYNFIDDPEHPERPVRLTAWRMRITVLEVNNIDPEIFVYNLGDLDPEAGTTRKHFQCVASPTDLVEYPIGDLVAGEREFFRLSSIDAVYRKLDVLDAAWDAIKEDVTELIEASAKLCELEVKETFTAGTLPEEEVGAEQGSSEVGEDGSSSSETVECPDDDTAQLEIVESNDPEFPVGTVLSEVGSVDGTCHRTWQATGILDGHTLTIVTSLVAHTAELTIAAGSGPVLDSAGLSHAYGAIFGYAYGPTQEYSIRIATA